MVGALLLKDQQVALAATEFWSGIIQKKDDAETEAYEERNRKIEAALDFVLPALLECCVMSKADRAAEMPVKAEFDTPNVE